MRMGERLKEKEIRLLRLRRPTAGRGGSRKERTTAGTDHLLTFSSFVTNTEDVRGAVTPDKFTGEEIKTSFQGPVHFPD